MSEGKKPEAKSEPKKAAASINTGGTYKVLKPSQYLRVNGKLQELEVGEKISLSTAAAKGLIARGVIEKA